MARPFRIRRSPIHGRGAFATRRIPAGTRLIEYAGDALMKAGGQQSPPCTVTAEFHVKLLAVTPLGPPLHLVARASELGKSSVVVEAELSAEGKVTATCRGVFVAVVEGHPAYHRW